MYDPSSNFAKYRRLIAAAQPPCIPFIGLIMTDLTFMDENSDKVEGSEDVINFKKFVMIGKSLLLARRFQHARYEIDAVPYLLSFFKGCTPAMTEKEIYARSLEIEPRGMSASDVKKLSKKLEKVESLERDRAARDEHREQRRMRVMDRSKRKTISLTATSLSQLSLDLGEVGAGYSSSATSFESPREISAPPSLDIVR